MRGTLISMIAVTALAVTVCGYSLTLFGQATGGMEEMRTEVLERIAQEDAEGARELLDRMEEMWSRQEAVLAVLAAHDALHEISALIIEGRANLEAEDLDDFNRSMALLGEALDHLHQEERLRLANIL